LETRKLTPTVRGDPEKNQQNQNNKCSDHQKDLSGYGTRKIRKILCGGYQMQIYLLPYFEVNREFNSEKGKSGEKELPGEVYSSKYGRILLDQKGNTSSIRYEMMIK